MARLELQSGDYEQAFEYILRAQKIQPDQYRIHELGGDIAVLAENYEVANDYYQKARSIKSDSELVIKSAEAFNRMAQHDQAINLLKEWLSKHPDDVRARQFLGSAYLNNGDNKEAIQAFEAVYAAQPENIVALNNLAWTYSLEEDDRALEFAEKAYNIRPEDSGVQDTYGWVLVQQGKVEKGKRVLAQAANALQGVPEVQYHYAVALMRSGEEAKARELLQRLLEEGGDFEGRDQAEKLMK
jgi:Tfp pilus assembly protein PilF